MVHGVVLAVTDDAEFVNDSFTDGRLRNSTVGRTDLVNVRHFERLEVDQRTTNEWAAGRLKT